MIVLNRLPPPVSVTAVPGSPGWHWRCFGLSWRCLCSKCLSKYGVIPSTGLYLCLLRSTHWGSNTMSTLTLFRDDWKPDPGLIPMADAVVGSGSYTHCDWLQAGLFVWFVSNFWQVWIFGAWIGSMWVHMCTGNTQQVFWRRTLGLDN
jgi:hypothetical protein